MQGASKRPATSEKKWRSMRKRAAEKGANRSCTAGTVPAAILRASRLCAGGLPQVHRDPPTSRSPSRASQRLTMCQRLLSTPFAWNQAYRPRMSSDMWRRLVNLLRELYNTDGVSAFVCRHLVLGLLRGLQFLVHAIVEIRVLRRRAVSASRSHQFHGYKPASISQCLAQCLRFRSRSRARNR